MAKRLFDRQARLLEYLTSGSAIFDGADTAILPPALHGLDPALLRLEARFSHEKRMEKILAIFPRTFEILGAQSDSIVRDFVRAFPPSGVSRISNGRQFHEHLSSRWRLELPDPPFLPDIAACEFACAQVRLAREELEPIPGSADDARSPRRLRRRPDAVLLRCGYDIRAVFEDEPHQSSPVPRDTPLAVVMPPGAEHPRVFEVLPVIFELLASLDDWTEPGALGLTSEHEPLIRELAEHHLIEVRP